MGDELIQSTLPGFSESNSEKEFLNFNVAPENNFSETKTIPESQLNPFTLENEDKELPSETNYPSPDLYGKRPIPQESPPKVIYIFDRRNRQPQGPMNLKVFDVEQETRETLYRDSLKNAKEKGHLPKFQRRFPSSYKYKGENAASPFVPGYDGFPRICENENSILIEEIVYTGEGYYSKVSKVIDKKTKETTWKIDPISQQKVEEEARETNP